MIKEWNVTLSLLSIVQVLTLLFAYDQVITSIRENNLQKATHKLNQIITTYGLTISVQKTKLMAFKG
jgi:outer membrane protein assembly factor BamD (BamD/ComL family)